MKMQVGRAFSSELNELASCCKSLPSRRFFSHFMGLCGREQTAYQQATSLLKLTASIPEQGQEEDPAVRQKRREVAKQLVDILDPGVMEALDASQEYGRCQPLYDAIDDGVVALTRVSLSPCNFPLAL